MKFLIMFLISIGLSLSCFAQPVTPPTMVNSTSTSTVDPDADAKNAQWIIQQLRTKIASGTAFSNQDVTLLLGDGPSSESALKDVLIPHIKDVSSASLKEEYIRLLSSVFAELEIYLLSHSLIVESEDSYLMASYENAETAFLTVLSARPEQVTYYPDGKAIEIKSETSKVKDVVYRTVSEYYEDGTNQRIAHYKNGKLDGEFIEYYDNGNMSKKEDYKDGVLGGATDKYGKSQFYSKNGDLIYSTTFFAGKKIESFYFLADGKWKSHTIYKDGEPSLKDTYEYDVDGNVTSHTKFDASQASFTTDDGKGNVTKVIYVPITWTDLKVEQTLNKYREAGGVIKQTDLKELLNQGFISELLKDAKTYKDVLQVASFLEFISTEGLQLTRDQQKMIQALNDNFTRIDKKIAYKEFLLETSDAHNAILRSLDKTSGSGAELTYDLLEKLYVDIKANDNKVPETDLALITRSDVISYMGHYAQMGSSAALVDLLNTVFIEGFKGFDVADNSTTKSDDGQLSLDLKGRTTAVSDLAKYWNSNYMKLLDGMHDFVDVRKSITK